MPQVRRVPLVEEGMWPVVARVEEIQRSVGVSIRRKLTAMMMMMIQREAKSFLRTVKTHLPTTLAGHRDTGSRRHQTSAFRTLIREYRLW